MDNCPQFSGEKTRDIAAAKVGFVTLTYSPTAATIDFMRAHDIPATPHLLYSLAEAARMLGTSTKTLRWHVRRGEISYVIVARTRRMFAVDDLEAFIASRRLTCPSIAAKGRRTSITTSPSTVLDFEAAVRRTTARPRGRGER